MCCWSPRSGLFLITAYSMRDKTRHNAQLSQESTGTHQAQLCWSLSSDLASCDSGFTHRVVIQQARFIHHQEHAQGLKWKVSEIAHLR